MEILSLGLSKRSGLPHPSQAFTQAFTGLLLDIGRVNKIIKSHVRGQIIDRRRHRRQNSRLQARQPFEVAWEGRPLHLLCSQSDSQRIRVLDLEDLVVGYLFAGSGFDASVADRAADRRRNRAVLRRDVAAGCNALHVEGSDFAAVVLARDLWHSQWTGH